MAWGAPLLKPHTAHVAPGPLGCSPTTATARNAPPAPGSTTHSGYPCLLTRNLLRAETEEEEGHSVSARVCACHWWWYKGARLEVQGRAKLPLPP